MINKIKSNKLLKKFIRKVISYIILLILANRVMNGFDFILKIIFKNLYCGMIY